MANANFTRDEIILSLDTYYNTDWKNLTEESSQMQELSELLQKLPIHAEKNRQENFRPPKGILRQIGLFRSGCHTGRRDPNISKLFFDVAFDFEDDKDRLHKTAMAIKRNIPYFESEFGANYENSSFPEGGLLEHLHRKIENRDGNKLIANDRCEICGLNSGSIYTLRENLIQLHLLVDPCELDGEKHYGEKDFISLCPNCHAVMHKIRPWKDRNAIKSILK